MSCACSCDSGTLVYFPGGTSARARQTVVTCADPEVPQDLTGATIEVILKRSLTQADDATGNVILNEDNGGIVIVDALLGLYDIVFLPATTATMDDVIDWFIVPQITYSATDIQVPRGATMRLRLDPVFPGEGCSTAVIRLDLLCSSTSGVPVDPPPLPPYATVAYVDEQDAATLEAANDFTDAAVTEEAQEREAADDTLAAAITDVDTALSAHIADPTAAHAASAISVTPVGNVAATTVQAAIAELDSEKQAVEQVKSASFTAVAGEAYVITASATVADPASPVNGQSYRVRVSAGTATVGGVGYATVGAILVRQYDSGGWSTISYEKAGANGLATLDATSKIPIAQIPTSDIQIIFRKGTDAERQTVIFAEGEGVYTTDLKEFWVGDGVTFGGVRPTPKTVTNTVTSGTAGSNLGGSGTVGSAGTTPTPSTTVYGGAGGSNASSGSGNGGNGAVIGSGPLFNITTGNGGAASGDFNGGSAGTILSSTTGVISIFPGNGGAAGSGGSGGNGGSILNNATSGVVNLTSGAGGAGSSTGTGTGGNAGLVLGNSNNRVIRLASGSGGAGNGNFNGGVGGNAVTGSAAILLNVAAGGGGAAGAGGAGGNGGAIASTAATNIIAITGGNGGAGGAGAAGGAGGAIANTRISFAAGAGGAGGSSSGDTGGAGGTAGSIALNGASGGTGTGGVAGGAGGAGGTLTLNGSAASGTTAGAAGGTINLSASGSTAAPHIVCGIGAPSASLPDGSLYLRMDGGAGSTLYVRESGAWAAK